MHINDISEISLQTFRGSRYYDDYYKEKLNGKGNVRLSRNLNHALHAYYSSGLQNPAITLVRNNRQDWVVIIEEPEGQFKFKGQFISSLICEAILYINDKPELRKVST